MSDPWLLTPGPLTTAEETRRAMLHDWGSRDDDFISMNRRVRRRLVDIVQGVDEYVCVPVQGSGTFAVEAMLGTLLPRRGKAALLVNGAYGRRMARILDLLGREYVTIETPEDVPAAPEDLDAVLGGDRAITHVLAVHCETTSGILNPIREIAAVASTHGRGLLIDAMSSFGALELDSRTLLFEAVAASSNKCLEGVPGMGFVIVAKDAITAAQGNAHSLSLDLFDQWRSMEADGQWRFTPPTHVVAALDTALERLEREGGVKGRLDRYAENRRILVDGMRAMGFKTLLADELQAPIIVTFHRPDHPDFDFDRFYHGLRRRGYVIYPGKLTEADSFRIGCIGAIDPDVMQGALEAVGQVLKELNVSL